MRFIVLGLVLSVVILVLGPGLLRAQGFGASVGKIYLSASATEYVGNPHAGSFAPFEFYIVAELDYADIGAGEQNLTNGIGAWEMRVFIPAHIVITQAVTNPANALNLGSNVNWLVGLGQTFTASTSPILLATYTGLIANPVTPENLILRVGGADPSTFTPATPGFVDGEISGECFLPDGTTPAKCKRAFEIVCGMSFNCVRGPCWPWRACPSGLPVESTGWGALKSTYRN